MSKPIVYFERDGFYPRNPNVGQRAVVRITSDHPVLGSAERYGRVVTTSTVQEVCADGSFETLNTIYRPQPEQAVEA